MRYPYSCLLPQYSPLSGGIKVVYALYGALLAKGEEVIGNGIFQDRNFVAIYPEITNGNPLEARHIVRYLLNKPGVMSGGEPSPTHFDATDEIFAFSKMFSPDTPDDHLMFLPAINTEVFHDRKGDRPNTAFFVGKGDIAIAKHPLGSIEITRRGSGNQELLAETLNSCSVLYTYDPVSAMTEIARLCGCRVEYCSPTYSRKAYELYEPGLNGFTFSGENIAPLDSDAFLGHYRAMQARFWNELLPNFIKITQKL
jgi:hypothetical protein